MSLLGGGYAVNSYARVLLDLVVRSGAASVSSEVRVLLDTFEDGDVCAFFTSPVVSPETKIETLLSVKEAVPLSDVLVRFMCVVVEDGLFADMSKILERFLAFWRQKQGRLNVEIVTATRITAAEEKQIIDMLKREYGEPELVVKRVDPEILGGFIVKGDSFVLDASFAGQLRELRRISREAAFYI